MLFGFMRASGLITGLFKNGHRGRRHAESSHVMPRSGYELPENVKVTRSLKAA